MGRYLIVVLAVSVGLGGWYVYSNYRLEIRRGPQGAIDYVKIVPRPAAGQHTNRFGEWVPLAGARTAIRVATFHLDGLDDNKMANQAVVDALVRVIPRFDVVAVQGVRSRTQAGLLRLIEQINATGRYYDFVICPVVERDGADQYSAILFDLAGVEIDRTTVQSIEDPQKRFRQKPLCASFRVRGPAESQAFTFTLINVQVDPNRVAAEVDLLADVFRAVRDAGRNEDDIILLGDLEADTEHLGRLGKIPFLTAAVTSTPTTTRGTRLADNILFDRRMTIEFTGRSGVLDLIRELDLAPQAALEVSEHLPVWAEFAAHEGGEGSHVAGVEQEEVR